MHQEYFDRFEPNMVGKNEVILAARGSAKTTLFCLIDPIHRAVYGTESFIVALSSTAPLSRDKTRDIATELQLNDSLIKFFNIDMGSSRISTEFFNIKTIFGECSFRGQSFFSQIRGLKRGHSRPSFMIFDDVTHGERVFSEEQRDKAKRQFFTDIRNAGQPETNYRFVGTTIHKEDLLMQLYENPAWKSYLYRAIMRFPKNQDLWDKWEKIMTDPSNTKDQCLVLGDEFYEKNKEKMNKGAKVLWPEREPLVYLMKERLLIGRRAFNAEKQMMPFLSTESLFQKIHWFIPTLKKSIEHYEIEDTGKFINVDDGRFVNYYALDPATGERKTQTQKKSLSFSARILAKKDMKTGKIYVWKTILNRDSPSTIINEIFHLQAQYNFERIGVEANLFKDLFGEYLKLARKEYQRIHGVDLYLPIYEIYAKEKKEQRIYSVEPAVTEGRILFSKYLIQEFKTQLLDYPNCSHNDGLDALEILEKISNPKNKIKRSRLTLSGSPF